MATTFPSLVDDGRPLKVVDGQLVTMPPASTASTAPSQSMQPGEWFDHVDDTQLEAREVDGFRGEGWAPEDATDALIGVRNRVRPRETVAAATVTLRSDAGVVVHAAATGANGRATIPLAGLPDGQYSLSITHASQSTNDVGPSIGGAGAPDRIWAPLASTMRIEGERFTSSSASQIAIGAGGRSVTVDLQPLWMRSPNFVRPRRSTLSHVVIHHTAGPVIGPALETFLSAGHTSAHYVVDVDGQIIKMVHEDDESAHAGCSHWGGVDSVNKVTVGIEIVNSRGAYPAAQMTSLLGLLERIFSANPRLSRRAVMSHADIATNCVNPGCDPAGCVTGPTRRLGRKSGDPGSEFDWPILEAAGFGMIPVARNPWPAMFGGFFDLVANGHLREGDADATRTFDGAVRAIDHGVIHELQIDLAELGYFCPRTGVFDRATRAAVEIFQEHFFAGSRRRTLRGGEVDQPTADMIKRVIGHSPPGDYPLPPTVTGGTRFA